MPQYIGSIDQGTSSTRFMVFDTAGHIIASHQTEFAQVLPQAGWVEHDLEVIYQTVVTCIQKTVADMSAMGLQPLDIKAIGITNQRETTCVWDRLDGKPLHHAIVWLDTRTQDTVERLIAATPSKSKHHFQSICGLPLSTYFSAVKLRWLLDNIKAVQDANQTDRLMFGTIDSWLIYRLTGGVQGGIHVTDVTNASRTMLLNLKSLDWDDGMLSFFGVNKCSLPAVKSSSEVYGLIADGPLMGIPIAGDLGDQQAALVGQCCFHPAWSKTPMALAALCYGSIAIAGAAVKWLRDNLGIISEASQVSEFAAKVPDTAGIYFIPAFSGLFAPYWRDDVRGCIVGMTQYTNKYHICRAALEATAFQTREILDAMNSDSGQAIQLLRVDGGLTNSDICMQIQADIAGVGVDRPLMRETTALGAALAAGLAVGVWKSLDDFSHVNQSDIFKPATSSSDREEQLAGWKKAVQKLF
ncbi:hypothetical protein BATDEDRAFT_30202 [Batrachochytrium dendrobatidis JAM81]|uniref:Probable glycerol kinase n=1 Tax=Batrachochytrium dendrobatidis (strain JAM81 / FGSC 10211) TaxID=684364 RepID=F4P501_BATDJ|nr:uncharacterized protein BATDEDRAFT_30202 [Batrachochytrium dendrobatidis JAM81]EGF80013.1 hypothetical protein BATDEDRAFT_30202 [Batrachochytrium dendrobatidis JAM81]|eukprot:XP_006679513.1 hypothetical protein BATDEDRAFT_30202 [Batrachochytrium dendrobatidis JAM81]